MKIADILALTGANKASIYRWMEKHPDAAKPHRDTLLGHPFPRPIGKEGREVIWNEEAVHQWWGANQTVVGRNPSDRILTIMPWESLRSAMLETPESYRTEDGHEEVNDDMRLVKGWEWVNDHEVRVWFRNATDAVFFKLKHY